jgi:hypothetical protein
MRIPGGGKRRTRPGCGQGCARDAAGKRQGMARRACCRVHMRVVGPAQAAVARQLAFVDRLLADKEAAAAAVQGLQAQLRVRPWDACGPVLFSLMFNAFG